MFNRGNKVRKVVSFDVNPEKDFKDLRKRQSAFGSVIGINLCGEPPNKWLSNRALLLFALAMVCWFTCFFVYQMIDSRRPGRKQFTSIDVFVLCGASMTVNLCFQTIMLYRNQTLLQGLFEQCVYFYRPENKFHLVNGNISKLIRRMHWCSYGNPILLLVATVIGSVVKREPQFIVPFYNAPVWIKQLPVALAFNGFVLIPSFYYNRVLFYTYSVFTILVHHVAGEYKCLGTEVRNLSTESVNQADISAKLQGIARRHRPTNVLIMVKDMNEIFEYPLLASELFGIFGLPMVGYFVWIGREALTIAIAVIFLVSLMISYSALGQHIISSAAEFEAALYACKWLEFSPYNRKQLALIVQMAQKPVGIKSGGFHLINNAQIFQILSRGYNILLCIVKLSRKF